MSSVRPQSAVGGSGGVDTSISLPQTPAAGEQRAGSTPRPATAGLTTARSSISTPRQTATPDDTGPHRDALSYFDTFKKEELRELIAQCTASWMLSPDFRGNATLPCGLVSNLTLNQNPELTLLFPKEDGIPDLEYRELHQIVRELTTGIFCGNQMPSLSLEPNFDMSSSCQMPVVYKDTRVGQVLMAVDYAMKSFWHGVYVPKKKRSKLSERWRALLDVNTATGECSKSKNPHSEFTAAGQENVTDKEEFKNLYEELNKVDPSEQAAEKEKRFFGNYSEFARCLISTHVSRVRVSPVANVVALHAASDVTSAVTLPDHDHIHPMALQRLQRRLRHHVRVIKEGMERDPTTRKNLALLRFIASVSVLLVSLRRRLMRIPHVDGLLTPLSGDVLRTESEIPPFAIPPKSAHSCEIFTLDQAGERRHLVSAHGEIQFDVDSDDMELISDEDWSCSVMEDARNHLKELLTNRPRQEYPVPTTNLDNDAYHVIYIPLVTYYPATPPQPAWLHARYQLLSNYRPRKLPMNDHQLDDMFKRVFGFRQAIANKSTEGCLKLSSCRGLNAPFITLMRKIASSSLFSPDVQGMTLLHHACVHNRASILSILLGQKPNLNLRRTEINPRTSRATPLHFAARCGALECVTALLASKVNPILSDARGYSAIHIACSADHTAVVRSLLRRHPNLLEVPATGGDNATPLLVAASSGALDSLKFLIKFGATVTSRDVNGDGPVQRAALSYHTDVIEYLIEVERGHGKVRNAGSLKVWSHLVEMLGCRFVSRQDASLRCLEVLLHRTPDHWHPLLAAGAVPPLVNLLRSTRRRPKSGSLSVDSGLGKDLDDETTSPIRSLACSVICLMSEQDDVRVEIANSGAIPTLISLLKPTSTHAIDPGHQDVESVDERCEIQSRSSVVLSDLAHVDDNASRIAEHGGIRPLVELLQVDVVDVLVNVINTLASLCRGDTSGAGDIQRRIMECGASGFLVDFLTVKDDALQAATADAIAAVCEDNHENQNEFVQIGVLAPLVAILRGHCIPAQMKAALAVGCITRGNPRAQHDASLEDAPAALCRLFQIWSDEVKERGACALWALAGHHPEQQRAIARRIGTSQIIDMLLSKSDTLQLIGCQAVAAWSWKSSSSQARLSRDNTVPPLIRLLRLERSGRTVVMATLDAINKMCIGVAHVNNKNSQLAIAEEGAIELLVNRVWRTSRDEKMQVDLLHCLSCLVSGCQENEDRLNELDGFGFEILLQVCNSPSMPVKLRAVSALAMFSFNRVQQQQKISRLGGLSLTTFEELFRCNDPVFKTTAAFQLVVLARIVTDASLVEASARGVITLVNFLDDVNDDVVAMAADYLASLAHTRAGVPDAIVTCGAVEKLLEKVVSGNELVRQTAAQALGYLSFNRTASREMMSSCRASEGLYVTLTDNLGEDGRMSEEFVAEYKRQATIGLPIAKDKKRLPRPQTAQPRGNTLRVNGTQHKTMRARSISPASRKPVSKK